MTDTMKRLSVWCAISVLVLPGPATAQGINPVQEWTTARADAQRTGWLRSDARISPASMAKPGFKFLWKVQLGKTGETGLPSEPVTFSRFSGERGWKTLASLGSGTNTYYSVDNDLGTLYLSEHLSEVPLKPGTPSCPGGMTSGISRPVSLVVSEPQGRGGGAHFRGVVSAPDEGTPAEIAVHIAPGRGTARAGPVAPAPTVVATPAGNGAVLPAGGSGGSGRAAAAGTFVLTSDGLLRSIGRALGRETAKPVQFVPQGSYASGLTVINNVAYAATMNQCGGVPDSIAAIDLASADKTTRYWKTEGGSPLGAPAFSENGTLFVSVGPAEAARAGALCAGLPCATPQGYSNAVVALDGKTLAVKDSFLAPAALASTPVVITGGDREYVAIGAKDGSIFLLDAGSLGGADHKTPLTRTTAAGGAGSLAAWRDSNGAAWVLASSSGPVTAAEFPSSNGPVTSGAVVAYKVGTGSLDPAWISPNIAAPRAPIIVNGVVFALSGGSASSPAVLRALDGATGKLLWTSGRKIASYVDTAGLSASQGQVYVVTHDRTFYAFGFFIAVDKF